ncbi:MAG TPA: corrinoid protein [Desulfosporosinus sp.]|nr:corrinoid protein [Desulfosporosinus sp.]
MSVNKEELFKQLSDAVLEMEEETAVEIASKIVEHNIDAVEAIEKGLSAGMERAGQLFEEEEYFIPELLTCSDAMYAGLDVLKPHIKASNKGAKQKVILGVIQGDTHDIGKNLVKIMLETSGFDVIDLGRDIPPQEFVDKAKEVDAKIIALSTLMTTTMVGIGKVVELLEQDKIREKFKVIVGGGPISQAFADKVGADGYARNATEAVKLVQRLLEA